MISKFLIVLLALLLALASAQSINRQQRRPSAQDPIGDYRARVRGFLTVNNQRVVNLQGFSERLSLPDLGAVMCHSTLQVLPKGAEAQGAQQQQRGGPVMRLFIIEKEDTIDLFSNAIPSMTDVGECFYARADGQNSQLNIGEWSKEDAGCGRNRDGSLWTRMISFRDADNKEVETTEAVCKASDNSIIWLETAQKLDGQQVYALHLDAIENGNEPTPDQQGLASFSLPAVCTINPQPIESMEQFFTNVVQGLGFEGALGGSHGSRDAIETQPRPRDLEGPSVSHPRPRDLEDRSNIQDRSGSRGIPREQPQGRF